MGTGAGARRRLEDALMKYVSRAEVKATPVSRPGGEALEGFHDSLLLLSHDFHGHQMAMAIEPYMAPEPFLQPIETGEVVEMERACRTTSMITHRHASRDDSYSVVSDDWQLPIRRLVYSYGLILPGYEQAAFSACGRWLPMRDKQAYGGVLVYSTYSASDGSRPQTAPRKTVHHVVPVIHEDRRLQVDCTSSLYRFARKKVIKRLSVDMAISPRTEYPIGVCSGPLSCGVSGPPLGLLELQRHFSAIEFCTANRRLPLFVLVNILSVVGIEPAEFIRTRILAFYNQDISSYDIARDIIHYSILHGDMSALDLYGLLFHLLDSATELSADWGCLSCYQTVLFLFTIAGHKNKYKNILFTDQTDTPTMLRTMATDLPGSGPRTTDPWTAVHSDAAALAVRFTADIRLPTDIAHSVLSRFSAEIVRRLAHSVERASPSRIIPVVCRLYKEYQARSLLIDKQLISRLLRNASADKADLIGYSMLLEQLDLVLPSHLIEPYKTVLDELTKRVCSALDSMLKSGHFYDIFSLLGPAGLSPVHRPNPLLHSQYLRDTLSQPLQSVYSRRIRKCPTPALLSLIHRSALSFQSVFGPAPAIEQAFRKASSSLRHAYPADRADPSFLDHIQRL